MDEFMPSPIEMPPVKGLLAATDFVFEPLLGAFYNGPVISRTASLHASQMERHMPERASTGTVTANKQCPHGLRMWWPTDARRWRPR